MPHMRSSCPTSAKTAGETNKPIQVRSNTKLCSSRTTKRAFLWILKRPLTLPVLPLLRRLRLLPTPPNTTAAIPRPHSFPSTPCTPPTHHQFLRRNTSQSSASLVQSPTATLSASQTAFQTLVWPITTPMTLRNPHRREQST
jgi:hypothetical protein